MRLCLSFFLVVFDALGLPTGVCLFLVVVAALGIAGRIEVSRHQAAASDRAPRRSCLFGLAAHHPTVDTPAVEGIPPNGASKARALA